MDYIKNNRLNVEMKSARLINCIKNNRLIDFNDFFKNNRLIAFVRNDRSINFFEKKRKLEHLKIDYF